MEHTVHEQCTTTVIKQFCFHRWVKSVYRGFCLMNYCEDFYLRVSVLCFHFKSNIHTQAESLLLSINKTSLLFLLLYQWHICGWYARVFECVFWMSLYSLSHLGQKSRDCIKYSIDHMDFWVYLTIVGLLTHHSVSFKFQVFNYV